MLPYIFFYNYNVVYLNITKTIITMEELKFYSKEINIMRQSQQKMAFDFCNKRGYTPTFMELQRITDVFVEVCLRPRDKDLELRIKNLDGWLDKQVLKNSYSIEMNCYPTDEIEIDGILID